MMYGRAGCHNQPWFGRRKDSALLGFSPERLETVSHSLQQQIVEGMNINLALLLMPDDINCEIQRNLVQMPGYIDPCLFQILLLHSASTKKHYGSKYAWRSKVLDEYQDIIISLSNETNDSD